MAKVLRVKNDIVIIKEEEVSGTYKQDNLVAPYERIVKVYGLPNGSNDGYKTDAEWIIQTPAGVATIYNYNNGKNYLGKEGLATKEITQWSIGGSNRGVIGWILITLKF